MKALETKVVTRPVDFQIHLELTQKEYEHLKTYIDVKNPGCYDHTVEKLIKNIVAWIDQVHPQA